MSTPPVRECAIECDHVCRYEEDGGNTMLAEIKADLKQVKAFQMIILAAMAAAALGGCTL